MRARPAIEGIVFNYVDGRVNGLFDSTNETELMAGESVTSHWLATTRSFASTYEALSFRRLKRRQRRNPYLFETTNAGRSSLAWLRSMRNRVTECLRVCATTTSVRQFPSVFRVCPLFASMKWVEQKSENEKENKKYKIYDIDND
jgi:hypothetical protein